MLTHDQIVTFYLVNKQLNKSQQLPRRLAHYMMTIDDKYADPHNLTYNPNSEIAQLLHHVAYGNLSEVENSLKKNPRLLLQAGDVIDPAGNTIRRVTAYECALGAGDDEMASSIGSYFKEINEEKERIKQYRKYYPSIDNMIQKPYDFSALVQVFKDSPEKDVEHAIALNFDHQSPLQKALEKLRQDFSPRDIKSGMHFNYANLLQALKISQKEIKPLSINKQNLFWCQVIGYIQRGMPACDRQAFAQGIFNDKKLQRTFVFSGGERGAFPITAGDEVSSGLGYKYGVAGGLINFSTTAIKRIREVLQSLFQKKESNLKNLCGNTTENGISLRSLLYFKDKKNLIQFKLIIPEKQFTLKVSIYDNDKERDPEKELSEFIIDALENNNMRMFKDLIDVVDPDIINDKGDSLLSIAVQNKNKEAVVILLNNDANIDIKNGKGHALLDSALKSKQHDIIKLIFIKDFENYKKERKELGRYKTSIKFFADWEINFGVSLEEKMEYVDLCLDWVKTDNVNAINQLASSEQAGIRNGVLGKKFEKWHNYLLEYKQQELLVLDRFVRI